jgi:hypothetical protein
LLSTRVATVPAVCAESPAGRAATRMTSRRLATRLACWAVANPPDWASEASTVSCSARASADCPASRTPATRLTRDMAPDRRAMACWSALVSVRPEAAATTVTAVSEAPCNGAASLAARWLGALAGRNEVLSL